MAYERITIINYLSMRLVNRILVAGEAECG